MSKNIFTRIKLKIHNTICFKCYDSIWVLTFFHKLINVKFYYFFYLMVLKKVKPFVTLIHDTTI